MSEKISEPIGAQTSDVLEWSRTLRSRSPSPSRIANGSRSNSPKQTSACQPTPHGVSYHFNTTELRPNLDCPPNRYIAWHHSNTRSRSPLRIEEITEDSANMSEIPKPTLSAGPKNAVMVRGTSVVKRSTGNMSKSAGAQGKMSKSTIGADTVEAEYIKNLQQQIYFLELETNYLREQAQKATELHPKMTSEAERMLLKLRQMQTEMDSMRLEIKRLESSNSIIRTEKEKVYNKLKDLEDLRARDKRMLMDEIIELKKFVSKQEIDHRYKDGQLVEARNELDKSSTALTNAETKILNLKNQVDQRIEAHRMTQINLEEKRSELLSVNTQLRTTEEKYYNSTVTLQDSVNSDLREEIHHLNQRLKEAELLSEQERHLRSKMSEDGTSVIRENAVFNQQVMELRRQLEKEKNMREQNEARHVGGLAEMEQQKDREKELKFELDYIKEQLNKEQDKYCYLQEQISMKDSVVNQNELQLNSCHSRISELTGINDKVESENSQLRKDKSLLVDHVSDLQIKLETNKEEMVKLRQQIMLLEEKVSEFNMIYTMESSNQTQKWTEFERLADSMRTLSHSMARTPTKSPLNRTRSPEPQ